MGGKEASASESAPESADRYLPVPPGWRTTSSRPARHLRSSSCRSRCVSHPVLHHYSLAMGSAMSAEAPRRLTRGLPRYPVPIVLLARLAIDRAEHGKGLGISLLFEALHRASLAAEHAAARLIAVDPIDEDARRFYLRWGFQPVEGNPHGRLFLRTRDALATFPPHYRDKSGTD